MACGCDEILEYDRNPPYVSQASLQRYINGKCSICNEAIAYGEEPTFPECCDNQIVTRGTSEVLRVDDASNTSYIGVGGALSEYVYLTAGTPILTANTNYTVPLSSAGLTTVTNDLGLTVAANGLVISRTGFYAIDVTFLTNNNTADRQTHYKIYLDGVEVADETFRTTGANPTEATNARYGRVVYNNYLSTGQNVTFIIHSGINITTVVSAHIRLTRLSVNR